MNWSDKNIIFIISLPRAGSTLLQRILAAHPLIHSTSESWLLLPQFYALRAGQVFSEYSHTSAAGAINDFCSTLPKQRYSYLKEVRNFATRLFQASAPPGKQYYLEKTPRNTLIIQDLIETFPNSKFIFLWRQPLASAASLIETSGKGHWNLFKHTVDLYDGLDNMTKALSSYPDKIISIQYEELLSFPEQSTNRLLQKLGLDNNQSLLQQFQNVTFNGRMGDPTGIKTYSSLSKEPLEKWKSTLNTPTRHYWARRYLRWLGPERLSVMGYDYIDLEAELESIRLQTRRLGSDMVRMSYGFLERKLQLKMFRHLIRTHKVDKRSRRTAEEKIRL